MQRIDSSRLAQMLNEGFEGKIAFSGKVFGSVREDERNSSDFYTSEGQFSLSAAGRDQGETEGSYLISNSKTNFYFKPTREKPIESNYHEGYGDIIAFNIDLAKNAVLQIEPTEIEF